MKQKKILIVDDSPVFLKAFVPKLSANGYEVVTAEDGARALGAVRRETPDLILLDVNFPPEVGQGGGVGWNGFRIMDWLHRFEEIQDIPIIMITGAPEAQLKQRALAAGATGFLPKSAELAEFLSLIAETLRGHTLAPPGVTAALRVLVFSTDKQAYFLSPGKWTKSEGRALDFGGHERAIQIAQELALQNVELVFVSDDGEPAVRLPLPNGSQVS